MSTNSRIGNDVVNEFVYYLFIRSSLMRPVLYYMPPSPPCRSILLLAKMLNVNLELKVVNILQGDNLKSEFVDINPQHCIPTLAHGDLVIWESRAILCYLASAFSKNDSLYPKDIRKRALVDHRLMFDLGTLYQRMSDYYFPTLMLGAPLDETKKAKLNEAVGWFNSILKRVDAKKPFVTGSNFTIADIALLVTVSQLEAFGYDLSPYAAVLQWLKQSKSYMEKYDYEEINGSQALVLADMFDTKLTRLEDFK